MAQIKQPHSLRPSEKGQSIAIFAIMLPVMALFLIGLLDYMVTNARVMEAVAISDLSAHAGAQEIIVEPNGLILSTPKGAKVAATYFRGQSPSYIRMAGVQCGLVKGRPACLVHAQGGAGDFNFTGGWHRFSCITGGCRGINSLKAWTPNWTCPWTTRPRLNVDLWGFL